MSLALYQAKLVLRIFLLLDADLVLVLLIMLESIGLGLDEVDEVVAGVALESES